MEEMDKGYDHNWFKIKMEFWKCSKRFKQMKIQSPDPTRTLKFLRFLINEGIQKRHHLNGPHLRIEINWNWVWNESRLFSEKILQNIRSWGLANDRMLIKNPGFKIDFERKVLKTQIWIKYFENKSAGSRKWDVMTCNAMQCNEMVCRMHAMICNDTWNVSTG